MIEGVPCERLTRLRALGLFGQLTLPNKRPLQAAGVHRFRCDSGSSPALFPRGGSGLLFVRLTFDAAAESRDVVRIAAEKKPVCMPRASIATLISAMADTSVFYTERLFQSGNQNLAARLEPHKHTTGTRLRYWHRGITVYMA